MVFLADMLNKRRRSDKNKPRQELQCKVDRNVKRCSGNCRVVPRQWRTFHLNMVWISISLYVRFCSHLTKQMLLAREPYVTCTLQCHRPSRDQQRSAFLKNGAESSMALPLTKRQARVHANLYISGRVLVLRDEYLHK